jgi:hypothetical protein
MKMFVLTGAKFNMEFLKAHYMVCSFFSCILMIYLSVLIQFIHILFADDTSVLIAESDVSQLAESSDHIFTVLSKWFILNKLTLKFY